jgi:hypothetical protein
MVNALIAYLGSDANKNAGITLGIAVRGIHLDVAKPHL